MDKLKKYHLYIYSVLLFVITVAVLNLKYDYYYRVPGITNEARLLIEEHLTKDERKLLVKDCIPVSSFIHYLQEPHFHLVNYQYYNQITNHSSFVSNDDLCATVNEMIDRLDEMELDTQLTFNQMVEENLLKDYVNHEDNFRFEFIHYYSIAKNNCKEEDPNYIVKVNNIIEALGQIMTEDNTYMEDLDDLFMDYTLDTLNEIVLYKQNHEEINIVTKPSNLLLILSDDMYLGEYEPKDLEILEEIPRLKYYTYLTKEAAEQYRKMYKDYLGCSAPGQMIIVKGYIDSEEIVDDSDGIRDYQLGNTIHVKEYGYRDDQFKETFLKEWLDENAYLYGFVPRFPSTDPVNGEKSYIYRYVGIEHAKNIHDGEISLRDYVFQD